MILHFAQVVLPFCKIVIQAQKPLPARYPREIKTVGDHIKKVRLERKLSQQQVAELLGISHYAVSDWEANIVSPNIGLMPSVTKFLGYVPVSNLSSMSEGEKIRTCRRLLGLTMEAAAKRLGVSITTLSSWENGRGIRKKAYWKVLEPFIASACRVEVIGG